MGNITTKLRAGDEVVVLAGRDVGKTGTLRKIFKSKNKANQFTQSTSNIAGKALGAIQGFLSEIYERYLSFSDNTKSILNEAVHYNGKVIL